MVRLELILIFVLQFEVGRCRKFNFRYYRPGEDAILPCSTELPPDTTCSTVSWIYLRDTVHGFIDFENGNVTESSGRAARLSVDTRCSLVIHNVTAEDVGVYTCSGRINRGRRSVLLCLLTLSSSPPDADLKNDSEITLDCSLLRHHVRPCRENSFRWLDETGNELRGEGVGYSVLGQTDCVSALTVKRQSGHNRRYTCQFVTDYNMIQADYTPVFTGANNQTETSDPDIYSSDPSYWSPLSCVMLTLRIAGLILMIVITVLVIRNKWCTTPLDNDNEVNHYGEVHYENTEARTATGRLR